MSQKARTKSTPELAALPAGDRLTAYVRRIYPTAYRLARMAIGAELGDEAARNLATVATGHTGAETAHGLALYGWNLGNLTPTSPKQDWYQHQDTKLEADGSTNTIITQRFRWFPNGHAGLIAYYLTIRDAPRYAAAWRAALKGSPSYLAELRTAGYFVGRAYTHPGETVPRLDTDAEMGATFAQHLERIRNDVEASSSSVKGAPQRRAIGLAIVGTIIASAIATIIVSA